MTARWWLRALCRAGVHRWCPTWLAQKVGTPERYSLYCRCPDRWCPLHGRHSLLGGPSR